MTSISLQDAGHVSCDTDLSMPDTECELSIVMPCLNEIETLAACIEKAKRGLVEANVLHGEILIADNGSTDGSQELAERLGARVVPITARGYGNAIRGGILAARGRYVIMGDSDDSYDFSAIRPFVEELRQGRELVMGNRFQGRIMPGAMPWKHKWIGNPVLSLVGRVFFSSPVGDFHCGLRGFNRDAYARLHLRTTGMEYASEMVIKATLLRQDMSEIPITLYKDGRSRPPHLRSWSDGWRHLRFMLLFSPRWLFLYPGLFLFVLGIISTAMLLRGPVRIGPVVFDIATLLLASSVCMLGQQLIVFAFFTKVFAISTGLHSQHTNLDHRIFKHVRLEFGLIFGVLITMCGLGLLIWAVINWQASSFGPQDPDIVMRRVTPAVLLMILGVQTIFASFFLGILSLNHD